MKTTCQASAKLILTGEHSILNKANALSLSINIPTYCHAEFIKLNSDQKPYFEIDLPDCQQKASIPFLLWQKMALDIESRYQLFQKNTLSINTVLKQPIDLILLCLYMFNQQHPIKAGHWQLQIKGHNLIGRGLGSSASVILSVLHSLYFQHNLNIDESEIIALARTIENRQHGNSSGLDPTSIQKGGMLKFSLATGFEALPTENFAAWLIDTGKPESNTGQTVKKVADKFMSSHPIWQDFQKISNQMIEAWSKQDSQAFKDAIIRNQLLLEEIGIVPSRVQQFIKALPKDTATKVCGAGSVSGQSAGVLICISDTAPTALCKQFGYKIQPIEVNLKGPTCEVVK